MAAATAAPRRCNSAPPCKGTVLANDDPVANLESLGYVESRLPLQLEPSSSDLGCSNAFTIIDASLALIGGPESAS
jgi:hypothetical protein